MANVKDIHVTLSEALASAIDRAARERKLQRADLIREALTDYLERLEKKRIERAMREYVDTMAPLSGDFVRETENETNARLGEDTEW